MKHRLGRAAIIAAIALVPAAATAGELRLSIANGRVTLVAQDVTVKQILDEWGRVGQTTIVGAERLTSASISLELNDVAEGRALESLLRTASGYIAKPRTTTAGASGYDRILDHADEPPAGGLADAATVHQSRPAAGRRTAAGRRRDGSEPESDPAARRRAAAAAVPRPAADAARHAARHAAADDGAAPGPVADAEPRGPWIPRRMPQGQPARPPGVPGSNFNGFPQQPVPPVVPGPVRVAPADLADLAAARSSDVHPVLQALRSTPAAPRPAAHPSRGASAPRSVQSTLAIEHADVARRHC